MSTVRLILLPVALLALAGCATAPKPLQGDFAATGPADAAATSAGKVRWGGQIIRVDNGRDRSCFEVLARPLDASARPLRRDRSEGRFLACRAGFYDPAVFEPGREITVTGTVNGSERRKVGDYDYDYPRVDADVIYLWNEPRYLRAGYPDPWFYGPYGYGWDPFWYRTPFPPVVIVHPHRRH
ncbi:Slp family lipoprotein [Tahibacter caeni]|uniref:Slp family lipoprotein n=1 Tax=Tahibacter caeni TaxID=1453545 RepID=UPI0021485CEB|nr:Slp family lipoprotein [Tahibacter caeni]